MRSQLWLVCLLARATSLQPPLSAAWVEEWKSGLVQHRPWDRRASSAYALLAANAEAPVARDRWRDGFALRATAADALRSVSARLDGVAAVDTSAEELAVSVPLAGGVGLRLVAADRRALARVQLPRDQDLVADLLRSRKRPFTNDLAARADGARSPENALDVGLAAGHPQEVSRLLLQMSDQLVLRTVTLDVPDQPPIRLPMSGCCSFREGHAHFESLPSRVRLGPVVLLEELRAVHQ